MSRVTAAYPDPDAALRAVGALTAAGFEAGAVHVMSATPLEGHDFGTDPHPNRVTRYTRMGGLIGLAGGILVPWLTAHDLPVLTGGMDLAPPWTLGVIAYETTLLGAILATVLGLFREAPLGRLSPHKMPPEVHDGAIVVAVDCADAETEARAQAALAADEPAP